MLWLYLNFYQQVYMDLKDWLRKDKTAVIWMHYFICAGFMYMSWINKYRSSSVRKLISFILELYILKL